MAVLSKDSVVSSRAGPSAGILSPNRRCHLGVPGEPSPWRWACTPGWGSPVAGDLLGYSLTGCAPPISLLTCPNSISRTPGPLVANPTTSTNTSLPTHPGQDRGLHLMWVHPGSSEPGRIPPIVGTIRDGTSAPCEHTVQRRARAPPHPPIKKKRRESSPNKTPFLP